MEKTVSLLGSRELRGWKALFGSGDCGGKQSITTAKITKLYAKWANQDVQMCFERERERADW